MIYPIDTIKNNWIRRSAVVVLCFLMLVLMPFYLVYALFREVYEYGFSVYDGVKDLWTPENFK